ncbi:MAG: hypothetical protein ACRDK9_10235 [Solirubrobacterales bacterium]
MESNPVTVRMATATDLAAIARVAERDSRPAPPGPHLVAERDGVVEAVLSLRTAAVVADPFRPTAELVELLRLRARSLRDRERPRRARRIGVQLRHLGAGGRA